MANTSVNVGAGLNYVDTLSTPYGLHGELPPELALQQQALNRRQQIANAMLQQATQLPQGRMQGKFYVPPSWTQNLAQLGEGLGGLIATKANQQEGTDITAKSNSMLVDAMQKYKQGTAPTSGQELEGPGAPVQTATPGQGFTPEELAQPAGGRSSLKEATDALFAQRSPAYFQEGARPTAQTPATPEARQQALVDLMASQHPQAQNLGKLLLQQDERTENRQMLHEEKQASLKSQGEMQKLLLDQKGEQMKQTLEIGKMQIQALDARGQDTAELKRDMQNKELAFKKWQTEQELTNKKDVAGMKGGKGAALSATAQKELFEADDSIASAKNVMRALDRALELNPKAYEGSTASTRAKALGYVPGKFADADATVELNNIVTGQTLEQLRSVFGATPTEGERKIMVEVQGSVDLKASQRQAVYERAKAAAQRRFELNQNKAKQLREGTYFSEQGGQAEESAAHASTASEPAALPSGAKQIGTSKGKPVYQLPDGSKVIAD